MAKPTWINLSKSSGTGNDTVQVTASAFTGRVKRTGTITGTATKGGSDSTTVEQTGKAEHITVTSESMINVPATGQQVTLQGTSNSAALKVILSDVTATINSLKINGEVQEDWDGSESINIPGDPGASAEYTWEIILTVSENKTGIIIPGEITIDNSNSGDSVKGTVSVIQNAGRKTYSEITITTGLAYDDIPASGGSVSPKQITYSQTWGWNGKTTGGGTVTEGATISYGFTSQPMGVSIDRETGQFEVDSLGTTEKERTKIATVRATISLNGKTANSPWDVYQSANEASYGEVTIQLGSASDVPASGGSVSEISGTTGTQTVTFTSGSERAGEVSISYGDAVTGANLGTTVKSRTQIGTLDVTATGEGGKTSEGHVPIYQQANNATYGEVTYGVSDSISVPAGGKEYDFNEIAQPSQTVRYTSGAQRTESGSNPVQFTISIEEVSPLKGFTTDGDSNTVTVSENTSSAQRGPYSITLSITGEGGKSTSGTIEFTQQASDSTLVITPETLTFLAGGESKTLTITSNDSWTLS